MRHAGFRVLRRGVDARFALIIAVAALLAAGAAVLAGQQALAQSGNNTNPKVHATPLKNGVAVDEFVIDELGGTALTHVELRLGSGNNGQTRATYQDYGRVELWLEERPGPNLHDSPSAGRRWYYSGGANAGSRLTLCDGGATNRCQLLKAEWKTLAGQSGVTSGQEATTNIEPIRLAFNIPTTITAGTIRLGVVHYSQFATRNAGGGSQWGPHSDWTVLTYGANITPVDDQDRPFWVRNRVTDSTRNRSFQYPFAAGQLSHVRLNAGLATALGDSRDTITYAQFTSVALELEDSSSSSALNSNNGAHQNFFTTTDGASLAACGTSGNACVIDKAEWQALAGQTGAAGTVVVKPIRIAIKVPREFPVGTPYNGASVKLETELTGTGVRVSNREATFKRLSAHISRLQTAKFNADADGVRTGGRTAVAPNANGDVADGNHTVVECVANNLQGQSAAMTDCYRDVEVGERIYVENILRVGGTTDNTGSSTATTRTNDEWLRVDAARQGVFFDRIEVAASTGGNAGGGIVAIGSLCPVAAPAEPVHPSGSAYVPRDRTAAALAKCVYNRAGRLGTYWGGTGPYFIPVSTGTVTVTLSYRKGADDPSTTGVDESLVAEDSLDFTVVAATDNTDTGNGGSDWDESDLIAELGLRSYDDSLSLLIGHRRNRGIPEFWGGATSPTGPGTITGAAYSSVDATEAVTLTVPAGGGYLELLGTSKSCDSSDSDSACTLTITRADLKAAARYGVPASRRGAAITDSAPYWPARLRFGHASPAADVTISGVLKRAPSGTTHAFDYTAKASAGISHGAVVAAYLPEDADDALAPSQTTKLAVGYNVPAASSGDDWRIFNPTPEFYEGKSYSGDILRIGLTDAASSGVLPASVRDSYLQLTGPATWTDTGGRRLRLDRGDYGYYRCVAASTLAGADAEGRICYISDASGNAPSITAAGDAAADIQVTASLPIWTLSGEAAPGSANSGGPIAGFLRARNTHQQQRLEAFGRATLRVAAIQQLSSISLGRTPVGGVVPSGPVRSGGPSADLQIGLLNENGGASQISDVSSVTLAVIGGGRLTSTYGCTLAAPICSLDLSDGGALAADLRSSAAGRGPGLLAGIPFKYLPGAEPAEVTLRATVVGSDGETYGETLALVVSGSAAAVAISGDAPRLLAYGTVDDDPATAGVNEGEDRDLARVPVTARDAKGAEARMPSGATVVISGPSGAPPAGAIAAEVSCSDDERLTCHVIINVNADQSSSLAAGEYTASVRAAGAPVNVPFTVAGDAETLVITAPGELGDLGESFSASVRAVDANGFPVADGTWVVFRATPASSSTVTAAITSPVAEEVDDDGDPDTPAVRQRRARTMNGAATANLTVVGNGITVLTASIGSGSSLRSASKPLDTRTAAVPAAVRTGPVLEYSVQGGAATTSTWATYRGSASTTADELLGHADAPADARIVWLWNGVEWIRYGEVDGTALPGSQLFFILPDDTVWFGE